MTIPCILRFWLVLCTALLAGGITTIGHASECNERVLTLSKQDNFKSIAFSRSSGKCFSAWGRDTLAEAEAVVLSNCRKQSTDCKLLQTEITQPFLKRLQKDLAKLGFYDAAIDGIIGGKTKSAIQKFQRSRGALANGKVTKRLVADIGFAADHEDKITESNREVCNLGTRIVFGTRHWETRANFIAYAREARGRGITLASCTTILNAATVSTGLRKKAGTSASKQTYKDYLACHLGTKRVGGVREWETRSKYLTSADEAKKRGLSLADCSRLLGDRPSQLSQHNDNNAQVARIASIAELDSFQLCLNGTKVNSGARVWDLRVAYKPYSVEAKKRNLSLQDCVRLLGNRDVAVSNSERPKVKQQNLTYKDYLICHLGSTLANDKRHWETRPNYAQNAAEAKRRGLSLQDCSRLLGDDPSIAQAADETSRQKDLSDASDKTLCLNGTINRSGKRVWETRVAYAHYSKEAQKRGFSPSDCTKLLNDSPRLAHVSTQQPAKRTDFEVLLCKSATSVVSGIRLWETHSSFRASVREAKARGLTLSKCSDLLADQQGNVAPQANSPSAMGSSYVKLLCKSATALEDNRRVWETRVDFLHSVEKAKGLGLTETDCTKAIGAPPQLSHQDVSEASSDGPNERLRQALRLYRLQKYAEALPLMRKLAWSDNGVALLHLGHMYALGQGVQVNKRIAVEWYRRAKDKGDPLAELMLASLDDSRLNVETTAKSTLSEAISSRRPEKRLALIIGNGEYEHSIKLPNPRNDAVAMNALLQDLGFETIVGFDLSKSNMETTIREFVRKAGSVDTSLFFYAGHGMQVGNRNFLVPTDAKLQEATAIDFELIDVEQTVVKYMGGNSKTGIILLDACRDNPLARSFARNFRATRSGTVNIGLAPMESQGGLLFGFATAPGDVAADGEGKHSPFTAGLLKHLKEPGLEIQQVMTRVKREVRRATNGVQRPWHNSDLTVEVFLAD